jgi:hypothetical protein
MKAKRRYLFALGSVAFLALCYFGGHSLKADDDDDEYVLDRRKTRLCTKRERGVTK